MASKGFPNVTTYYIGSQQYYKIKEKPSVILYPNINHHAGTPKQQSRNTVVVVVVVVSTLTDRASTIPSNIQ